MYGPKWIALACIAAALPIIGGCALTRLDAVPVALEQQARIPLSDLDTRLRYRVGSVEDEAALAAEFVESWRREREYLAGSASAGLPSTAFLALSGGGDNGAFGAGLLNGWTASGTRPVFKLVTGISTGALIAPFAFLGSDYDDELKDFYTNTKAADIMEARSFMAALTSDAMADTGPLRALLRKSVDRDFLDAIAAEYLKGRELWIATTDLDKQQRYIWNLSLLATSRDPRAMDLFHSLMIASAAIPGAFPPVLIDVEVGADKYQEMHVDGGAMAQVFVYPVGIDFEALAQQNNAVRQRHLYVIRNSRLDPEWAQVERKTLSIAARAIASLIHTQGMGDLYRIFLTARRDKLDFNLAYIPASFDAPHTTEFDPAYMGALFEVGYELARKGYPWHKSPPGFADEDGH